MLITVGPDRRFIIEATATIILHFFLALYVINMTAQSVISSKYPPQIDVTKTPLAFGTGAIPRLVSIVKLCYTFYALLL